MSQVQSSTRNFLVPSDGTTHTVQSSFTASAIPYIVNWDSFKSDRFAFYPQGAYFDNSLGTSPLVVKIAPVNFNLSIPAGVLQAVHFPAPTSGTICTMTGAGTASVFWVDYPIIPYALDIANGGAMTVQIADLPLPVDVPANSSGAPYQIVQTPFGRETNSLYIAATTTASAAVQMPTGAVGQSIRIVNAGTVPVAILLGAVTGVVSAFPATGASANSLILAPGATEVFNAPATRPFVSVITQTGTADVFFVMGSGS